MTATTINIPTPEQASALTTRAAAALRMVEAYTIDDRASFEQGNAELGAIKEKLKALDAEEHAITDPINAALRATRALFKPVRELLQSAESVIKGKMTAFVQLERAKADAERAEAERRGAELRERLAAQARAAEAQGQSGEAQTLRSMAQVATVAPATPEAPKATGFSLRKVKVLKVHDFGALVAHIAAHPELHPLLKLDESATLKHQTALGAVPLPGVTVETTETAARRV